LIERIKKDDFFEPVLEDLPKLLDPKTFVGRAPEQVVKFVGPTPEIVEKVGSTGSEVDKALKPYADVIRKAAGTVADLTV